MASGMCKCDGPVPALKFPGEWHVVTDTDAAAVSALFTGALDYSRCPAGCPLGERPGIVFIASDPDVVVVVPGSVASGGRSVSEYLGYAGISAQAIRGKELNCHVVADAEALRGQFRDLLLRRASSVQSLVLREWDLSAADWRVLTPAIMASLPVVYQHRLGEPDESDEAVPDAFLAKLVAQCQVKQWMALCLEQSKGTAPCDWEADLRRFVDSAPVLGGARELIDDWLAETQGEPGTAQNYCFLALQARVHHRAGLPPPQPENWAYEWLKHQMRNAEPDRLHIPWESAGPTIPQSALLRAARRVYADAFKLIPPVGDNGRRDGWNPDEYRDTQMMLLRLMTECGAGEWVAELVRSFGLVRDIPLDNLADAVIDEYSSFSGDWTEVMDDLDRQIHPLMRHRRVADLERIADALQGNDSVQRARLDLWLCAKYLALDLPSRITARLGAVPQPAEAELPERLRIELAMMRIGAVVEFVTDEQHLTRVRDRIDELAAQFEIPPGMRGLLGYYWAMTLRYDPGRCMAALQDSVSTMDKGLSPLVLARIAALHEQLGRLDLALESARQSYTRAADESYPWPMPEIVGRVLRLEAATGAELDPGLLDLVAGVDPETEPAAMITVCRAILTAGQPIALSRTAAMLTRTREAVDRIVENAEGPTYVDLVVNALHLGAWYDQVFRPEQAFLSWMRLAQTAAQLRPEGQGIPPFADCSLYLASTALREGGAANGRFFLRAAHLVMTAAHLDSQILTAAMAGKELRPAVNAATAAVLDTPACSGADLRITAEMSRGIVSRVRALQDADRGSTLSGHLSDDDLASLAPADGRLAVLEWITDGERTRGLVTVIDSAGRVRSRTVRPPDVDLGRLNRKLANDLSTYRPRRRGSPFDRPDWQTCAEWLRIMAGTHLDEPDHLVIIPAEPFAQLPWHVATAGRWTCSYQPNWEALLASSVRQPARELRRAGIAVVPKKDDPPEVLDAMAGFVTQMRTGTTGTVLVKQHREVDEAALRELFEHTDIATVLAHGYIDESARETFLMIACEETLPRAHAVANGSKAGRGHRFGWRDCVGFARAPEVLFFAACSSGRSHATGLGEQLGFFNALRPIGLRALVAPRWDVVAKPTLDITVRAQELYIGSGNGLAACVRQASVEALRSGVPDWVALAMAVEGDWR